MPSASETSTGLVLRTWPFSETSLIVHWLTREAGRVATLARGARRPKSPLRGKLDLFFLADFSFQRSARSDLHQLREVNLLQTHPGLRRELGYLQQASYCGALVEQATEADTPLPAIFELMSGFLTYLPVQPPEPQTVFAFELKLLSDLGLYPDVETSHLSPGAKQLVRALVESEWPSLGRLRLSGIQVTELRRFLHGFLIFHLGRIPQGRSAATGSPAD